MEQRALQTSGEYCYFPTTDTPCSTAITITTTETVCTTKMMQKMISLKTSEILFALCKGGHEGVQQLFQISCVG